MLRSGPTSNRQTGNLARCRTLQPSPTPPFGRTKAYLARITVEGFRGIGPARSLDLQPGNGLTLVEGRNGAGKSSFAEGIEALLVGSSKPWGEPHR